MAANRINMTPAAHSDHTAMRSRSIRRATCPAAASPRARPTPKAVTTSPQPELFPPSVYWTKIGMIASTAPIPANAITSPPVIAEAIESSRRNRIPSRVSRNTRLRSIFSFESPRRVRSGMP